jgi:hypothetical protein
MARPQRDPHGLIDPGASCQPVGPRQGPDYQNLHRNKPAMTLNLKDPKGLEVFRRLATKADVAVENLRAASIGSNRAAVMNTRQIRCKFGRRKVCRVISGGQFRRTGNKLVPTPLVV